MSGTSPFNGGERLTKTLHDIDSGLSAAGAPYQLSVGFLEGKTYPDGTSIAYVAAIQNWGSGKIPPRPFFTNMIVKNAPTWGADLATVLKLTNYRASSALGLLGERIKGQLQISINETNTPPLSPFTILRKGGGTWAKVAQARLRAKALGIAGPDKPLIDTGLMWNSIDYVVTTTNAIPASTQGTTP